MKNDILRIAILGPESTGKSTLAQELADSFQTVWVPEHSRNYVETLGRQYDREDILFSIREQCKQEDELMTKANTLIFADTDPIVAKVWMEDVFQESNKELDQLIQDRAYDLYLLLYPDLPFVQDSVRENPSRREYFFNWYKSELKKRKFRYCIISGSGPSRFKNAKNEIDSFLADHRKT